MSVMLRSGLGEAYRPAGPPRPPPLSIRSKRIPQKEIGGAAVQPLGRDSPWRA
jgi:hypothetical protein